MVEISHDGLMMIEQKQTNKPTSLVLSARGIYKLG